MRLTPDEFNQILRQGKVTVERTVLPAKSKIQTAKPEQIVLNESLGENGGEAQGSKRVHVRITSLRKRLIDPDNITVKWIIDCLRYADLIKDDREKDITLEVSQKKAEKDETLIELFYGNPA